LLHFGMKFDSKCQTSFFNQMIASGSPRFFRYDILDY